MQEESGWKKLDLFRQIPSCLRGERKKRVEELGKVSFVEGDLTSREFVNMLIRVYKPDTILHLAAQPSARILR
ncbi:GDP-mannose 4,6-dehydratase [Archaeoglobus sp.]